MIDDYNRHKSEVDRYDQTRSYYTTQQRKHRTWRPLLYFLLDITLNNIYRLSSYSTPERAKRGGHKQFLYRLIEQLFERGGRLCQGSQKRQRLDDVTLDDESAHGLPVRLYAESKACIACSESGRTNSGRTNKPRAPLTATTGNIQRHRQGAQRPPRTTYGCKLCKVPLCRPQVRSECWEEHLRRAETIKSINTSVSSTIK